MTDSTEKQFEMARNASKYAEIFWLGFTGGPPTDAKSALLQFLANYAYERQGSARAYRTIASRVIPELFDNDSFYITRDEAVSAWNLYREIASKEYPGLGLNDSHNPLNSDKGILCILAENSITNIYAYTREMLVSDQIDRAYEFLSSIRGIGDKITSLYLRDLAHYELVQEKHFDYHFQPIDTWVKQALEIILSVSGTSLSREPILNRKLIVDLCRNAGCSPVDFNSGAWMAGSRIAQDYGLFKRVLENVDYGIELIRLRINEYERITNAMKIWSRAIS